MHNIWEVRFKDDKSILFFLSFFFSIFISFHFSQKFWQLMLLSPFNLLYHLEIQHFLNIVARTNHVIV